MNVLWADVQMQQKGRVRLWEINILERAYFALIVELVVQGTLDTGIHDEVWLLKHGRYRCSHGHRLVVRVRRGYTGDEVSG